MNNKKKTVKTAIKPRNPKWGKGKSSWNKGIPRTKATKDKIGEAMKKAPLWNRNKKHSPETIAKMKKGMKGKNLGKFENEENPKWKGDEANKEAMHKWVARRKGKASDYTCEFCGEKKAKHWANKRHDYKRVLSDYMALCPGCHGAYDVVRKGSSDCVFSKAFKIKYQGSKGFKYTSFLAFDCN